MYGRISYLNNSLSSWAIHRSNLRRLPYYIAVWLGASPSVPLTLTSRRFLRELDKAPGGNNLQYILKCPCILFFGNQGLHNEIMLGGNGRALWGHMWGILLFHSEFGSTDSCYDLVKQLSHYSYFFSISFLFLYYTERSVGKYHITSVT